MNEDLTTIGLTDEELFYLCYLMDGQMDLVRLICEKSVRQCLEELHCGTFPSTKTGDYSDVKVVSPYGEIPWNNISRISDPEMRQLMLHIETSVYNMFSSVIPKLINLNSDSHTSTLDKIKEMYKDGVSWDLKEGLG